MAGIDNFKEQHEKMKNGLAAEIGAKGGTNKKGSRHINTWIQELLEDEDFTAKIRIGYEIQDFKGAPLIAIIKAQMIKAIEGDTKAFDSLAKYGYGATLDITSDGEPLNGLTINVTNIDARLATLITGRQIGSDRVVGSGESPQSQD